MQDETPTIQEKEKDMKTISMIIFEQFANHKIRAILISLILFLIASLIVFYTNNGYTNIIRKRLSSLLQLLTLKN